MGNLGLPSAKAPAERDRSLRRGARLAAGFTALPRWTQKPAIGFGEHDVRIPDTLVAALLRGASEVGVPLRSVLLAAHAKVLGALTGERDVRTGYVVAAGGPPSALTLSLTPRSWGELLLATRRAELEMLAHADNRLDDPPREPGEAGAAFETVFDPAAESGGVLGQATILWIGVKEQGGLVLRLLYRTEALDAAAAARIAGYHLTALAWLAADSEAEHARQSLLSADELELQLEGLAGPRRELPDRRVHELFEARARAHPDDVAAVYGDRQWTYRQLNAHANRLGRALLARGLRREDVVAVVTERNLDWMAAVLAILKVGGAYLPIEPHFPPDRIARTLARAGCRLVLTERASEGALTVALRSVPGARSLLVDAAHDEGRDDGDLGVDVAPHQLAYVFFTSGSTGEPKGAMCEHAGMLNHILAKIHDLGIGQGDVVAQTAPQCFDISLWQLLAALLVGGRTLLVEQDAILDAGRFLDTIARQRVNVLQVVPSYLEALLSFLEREPSELPDLKCMSATGEALSMALAQRWFRVLPGIRLVNAYGLTETSDDTNHEIMDGVPDGERIPIGPPIQNVCVRVVDERLALVPLGAPGEIVFAGVCVGRGYVNDPERTTLAFPADPYREGERLYRSGDYGRWLPEGKLDFLGRRDAQVKVNGFRIEIGEIERALTRLPGIRNGAVVVAERAGHGKHLVAFYSGPEALDAQAVRSRLSASLPEYMLPTTFQWRDGLPLTANGKIDRKALASLAGELAAIEREHEEPKTRTEARLAAAWAGVLGIPEDRIGRQDHFFDLGGTSLSAVKLAIRLDREVTHNDLASHAILADLAALIDDRAARRG